MDFADDIWRASHFAQAAFKLMQRHKVPPTPSNYTVWYGYVSGISPDLKKAIDGHVKSGKAFDDIANEGLFDKFFGSAEEAIAVQDAGRKMHARVSEVLAFMDQATDGAKNYGQSLQRDAGALTEQTSIKDIRAIVKNMVQETKTMLVQNQNLQSQLSNASDEIDKLRNNLANVQREALTDGLTGIANRKSFDVTLRNAASEAQSEGTPLCLILTDIDHFKKFNDTYGHQTGDQVLRLFAAILTRQVKGRDTPARYGGEEFGVILPETSLDNAVKVGEQIRAAVAAKRMRKKNSGEDMGNITISLGVSQYRPGEPLADLIKRADDGLYQAKHQGRNQVVSEANLTAAAE